MKNLSFFIFVYIPIFCFIMVFISGCLEENKKTAYKQNILDPTTQETIIETREYKQSPQRNLSQDPFRIGTDEGEKQKEQTLDIDSWAKGERENGKNGKNEQMFQLFVNATPPDSRIRIMNIKPKYQAGILLKPGKYDIKVSKRGYNTNRQWITIEDKDFHLEVELVKR